MLETNSMNNEPQHSLFKKDIFLNCGLFMGTCLVLFIATELVFRIFLPQSYDPYLFDPIIGSRKKPGMFAVLTDGETHTKFANSAGFIDEEWGIEKPPGLKRIAMLGDSFLQAIQVDDKDDFESMLESKLTDAGIPTEVFNFGIRGMGTTQQYLTLEHYALAYKPDLIIVAAFLFNDVEDNSLPLRSATVRPYIVFENGTERIVPPKDPTYKFPFSFFREHSHFYRWLVNRYFDMRRIVNTNRTKNSDTYQHTDTVLPFFDVYSRESQISDEWQEAWFITKEMYRRMKVLADTHSIPLFVVLIPSRYELYPEDWKAALEERRDQFPVAVNASYDLSLPRKKGVALFEDLSILYLDLYDDLATHAGRGEELYMPVDGHFNAHGHEVVAGILYEAITKAGMLR